MGKERLARPHGILVHTKRCQPVGDEIAQGPARVVGCDGPVKPVEPPGMRAERRFHQTEHLASRFVRRKRNRLLDALGPSAPKLPRFSES